MLGRFELGTRFHLFEACCNVRNLKTPAGLTDQPQAVNRVSNGLFQDELHDHEGTPKNRIGDRKYRYSERGDPQPEKLDGEDSA